MNQKIQYFSTDKMYTVNNKKFNLIKLTLYFISIISVLLFFFGIVSIFNTITNPKKDTVVSYNEKGKADYVVYLKENSYYNSKYLKSGMQYVASLINTINATFNYEIHSDKNLNYNYKYKIIGTLQILDKTDSNKILYTKDDILLKEVEKNSKSNNFVINENVNIDYDEYNNYVNAYKREYGLTVDSHLILTMQIDIDGKYQEEVENLNKTNKLQITIPLSEQTVDIAINTANIDNSNALVSLKKNNMNMANLLTGIISIVIAVIFIFISKKIYDKQKKGNIYEFTLNKIKKDYDRLLVDGTLSIQEDKYNNIIYPVTFEELVDASENLQTPILHYDVIPGEKSFFVIIDKDTLYKFRLTKAYLEKEEYKKTINDLVIEKDNNKIEN